MRIQMATKDEMLDKFKQVDVVAPPETATKDEIEQAWYETVRSIHQAGHPNVEKISQEDIADAYREHGGEG